MILIRILFIIICIFSLGSCSSPIKTEDYIKKEIGIDISSCIIEEDNDNHGGFLGDGSYIVKANCEEANDLVLDQLKYWEKLPLSENLQLIIYGGEKDGTTYSYELGNQNGIPKIKNGYYYFLDRHNEATNKHSDKYLFDRYSFNFTIALYDVDTKIFYYYEFDT